MKNMIGTILMVVGASFIGVGAYVQFKPQAAIAREVETTSPTQDTPKYVAQYTQTPEQKGYDFEKYIVTCFNKKYFTVEKWTGDKYVDGQYDPSNMDPDIVMKLTLANKESHSFAVECKWRSHFKDDVLQVASNAQLKRYLSYSRKNNLPTFVAVGVGGAPNSPKHLYIVPIQALQYGDARKSYLEKFEVEADGKLYYDVENGRFN